MFSRFLSSRKAVIGLSAVAIATLGIFQHRRQTWSIKPTIKPDGDPKSISTLLLESGAKLLQSKEPLKGTDVYFVAFHPMKDHPCHQMEAHHYCKQVNEDFAQCLLYDGNTKHANLTGLEYIISEKLFKQLPEEEHKYWHPHNYEILSGQLILPGLPSLAEKSFLTKQMNSYGKTYHTWRAKCWEGEKPYMDTLPKGEALLAWSFNHDREVKPDIVQTRDKNLKVSTETKRKERQSLVKYAHPQEGVNYLASSFKHPIVPIAGVKDVNETNSEKAAPSKEEKSKMKND